MSTAARAAEAEKAAIAYQVALTKLGATVVAEALLLWRSTPPTTTPAAGSWMAQVVRLVMRHRAKARALARAYFRLERALRTGYTVGFDGDGPTVSLGDLRDDFRRESGEDVPSSGGDSDVIDVEDVPEIEADVERQDREAEREVRVALGNLGPMNLAKKLAELSTDDIVSLVEAQRERALAEAGARQAAAAERIALNGARSELWAATNLDGRVIGYVRLSRTGTPCGWCAMLISRGFVEKPKRAAALPLYRSLKGAGGENLSDGDRFKDGDLYHDNCHCYAVPVYSMADLQTSPLYALNREYGELWPEVTKGLGGDSALTAWRRFIRTQQRAQAARPRTSAQEA